MDSQFNETTKGKQEKSDPIKRGGRTTTNPQAKKGNTMNLSNERGQRTHLEGRKDGSTNPQQTIAPIRDARSEELVPMEEEAEIIVEGMETSGLEAVRPSLAPPMIVSPGGGGVLEDPQKTQKQQQSLSGSEIENCKGLMKYPKNYKARPNTRKTIQGAHLRHSTGSSPAIVSPPRNSKKSTAHKRKSFVNRPTRHSISGPPNLNVRAAQANPNHTTKISKAHTGKLVNRPTRHSISEPPNLSVRATQGNPNDTSKISKAHTGKMVNCPTRHSISEPPNLSVRAAQGNPNDEGVTAKQQLPAVLGVGAHAVVYNRTSQPRQLGTVMENLPGTSASSPVRSSSVGTFAASAALNHQEEEMNPLERGNDEGSNNSGLVVAQLAVGHSFLVKESEELRLSNREKEQENQELREELKRISANTVDAEQVQIIAEGGITPTLLTDDSKTNEGSKRWFRMLVISVVLLVVVVTVPAVVLEGAAPSHNSNPVNSTLLPVLDTIKKNDMIRCRAETVEVNNGEGFTIDLCRALAAAVLGDPSKVAFLKIPFRDQFKAISMGEVDISTTLNTLNMERDVYHLESSNGYTFSDPYFFSGTTFAGIPDFVDCVDRGEAFEGLCRQLVICVISNTVTKDLVNQHFPGSSTKLVKDGKDLLQTFVDGRCNVMAEASIAIYEQRVRDLNFTGDYVFAKSGSWTFEPFAMITRQSDPQWSNFVNWVLRSLITAESLDITHENAYNFPQTKVFGEEYRNMFRLALGAVGNYGQMYERHFQERVPRQGMNLLHRGEPTGLLVADPLGDILIDESLHQIDPTPNGTLEAVMKRGYLRCGLSEERVGFAEFDTHSGTWSGLDVEFCKGISASIFAGMADTIVYGIFDGAGSNQFRGLADGRADVLAGGTVLLRSDVNEPMTGRGYTFSPPYFFEEKGARRAMLTRDDDPQWSDLVRWVSQAPVYAESKSITQWNASMMPIVELFSTDLRQMLRDTIAAIGNYKEIYNRTMEHHIPRHGWNHLNSGNDPQHFPYSFGD